MINEMIAAEQSSFSLITDGTRITNIKGDEYRKNDLQQHLTIASWAEDRQPPFGKGKEIVFVKQIRKENREK